MNPVDPLAAAKLGDTILAAQPFQDDADLVFGRKCRRVARRMSFTTCSAGSFAGTDFCFIFAPSKGYDEPEILPCSTPPICLMTADGGHSVISVIQPLETQTLCTASKFVSGSITRPFRMAISHSAAAAGAVRSAIILRHATRHAATLSLNRCNQPRRHPRPRSLRYQRRLMISTGLVRRHAFGFGVAARAITQGGGLGCGAYASAGDRRGPARCQTAVTHPEEASG